MIYSTVRLSIDCNFDANHRMEFLRVFSEDFYPAISSQDGFIECLLLTKSDELSDECLGTIRIDITFNSELERQNWVASEIHQKVWGRLSAGMISCSTQLFKRAPELLQS